ncbi:MAG TPA: GNAT family N-acetyltransferase [Bacteroidia bacterium]|nr:GNAT family N-acetyltransferase [Bacteroidia bacterium]
MPELDSFLAYDFILATLVVMQFKTLENTSIAELLHVFNEAFSDYPIPMHLTKESLINKFVAESIKKEYSAGAFEGDKLVGFILHGIGVFDRNKIAYNAGTGVIPSKRGNKITSQLYEFILPVLKSNKVNQIRLEVLSDNSPAMNTYSSIGFHKKRTLNCYKGSLAELKSAADSSVQYLYQPDWKLLQSFWDWSPSWQNSISAVNNSWSQLDTIGLFAHDKLVGYIVFNPKINRILQFSIDKSQRKNGFGKQLLNYFALNKSKTVSILNVDDNSIDTNSFFLSSGLNLFAKQDEMEMEI